MKLLLVFVIKMHVSIIHVQFMGMIKKLIVCDLSNIQNYYFFNLKLLMY